MDDAHRPPSAPGPLASFARFVLCGGGVGVLSSFAVALLALLMPWGLANAVITLASTLLCTELHARFTFGAGRRAGWRQHWQSAGSAAAAYVVTCAAMFILHLVQSSPSMLNEQIVYLSSSGLAGIGRFLVLRLFVFAGRKRIAAPMHNPVQDAEAAGSVPPSVRGTVRRKFAPPTRRTVNTAPDSPSPRIAWSVTTGAPVRRSSLCRGVGFSRPTGFPVYSSSRPVRSIGTGSSASSAVRVAACPQSSGQSRTTRAQATAILRQPSGRAGGGCPAGRPQGRRGAPTEAAERPRG